MLFMLKSASFHNQRWVGLTCGSSCCGILKVISTSFFLCAFINWSSCKEKLSIYFHLFIGLFISVWAYNVYFHLGLLSNNM